MTRIETPASTRARSLHALGVACGLAAAVGVFVYLARGTVRPPIALDLLWTVGLIIAMLGLLVGCGTLLWRRTRFS